MRGLLVACVASCALVAGLACTGGEETTAQADTVSAIGQAQLRQRPSFRLFAAWLESFNSGDRDRYGKFLEERFLARSELLDGEMVFRELTGGLDLRKVTSASATKVTGWVEERSSDQFAEFELGLELDSGSTATGTLEPAKPYEIATLELRAMPRPEEFPVARLTEAEAIAAVDALARKSAAADRFSGAVLFSKGGEVLFSKAYGLSDRDLRIPNTAQTRFRIGSLNKMFTAVAILQLVEGGKLELEAPVGTYLRDYPNREVARKVTIHHLLTHTGGMGDIFGPAFDLHRDELRTLADYVKLYGRRGPEFEPGSRFAYSNYGFILLGVIIETVSARSYYDYVTENVYERAGMTASGSLPEHRAADLSVGYITPPPGTDGWTPNVDTLPYRGTSAGGGYSTVEDLSRFADALLGRRLLSRGSTELLVGGKVPVEPWGRYAYGFEDARDGDGNGAIGHGGGAPGMNADLRIYPKSGYVVAVLTNMDPPAATRISSYVGLRLPTDE